MKIEFISVVEMECWEVTTNEPLPLYRRYGPDHYEHYLGDLHGWRRYPDTEILEEVYDEWTKKTSK